MRIVILPTDRVYMVCSKKTGVALAVFASREAAYEDVEAVNDGRYVAPWVLRGATFAEVPE